MQPGDTCTTDDGRSGFAVATGEDGETRCVAAASFGEAMSIAGAAAEQAARSPESDRSIERNNPPQEGESSA